MWLLLSSVLCVIYANNQFVYLIAGIKIRYSQGSCHYETLLDHSEIEPVILNLPKMSGSSQHNGVVYVQQRAYLGHFDPKTQNMVLLNTNANAVASTKCVLTTFSYKPNQCSLLGKVL